MKTNIAKLTIALAAAATLTACSNSTDMYDEAGVEQTLKASYAENFVKNYPDVNLNQSWDYTSHSYEYSLPTANKARTRAVDYTFTEEDWYEVDNNTLAWLQANLPEGVDHTSLGNPFYMSVPGTQQFTIVPIFQGGASAKWDLHVVVDGQDIKIWSKSQDVQVQDDDNAEWHPVHNTVADRDWESDVHTQDASKVRAIPYTVGNLPVGAEMYFYLEITQDGNGQFDNGDGTGWRWHYYNFVGSKMSSLSGMMLALTDVPLPTNLPEGYKAMVIACEDADQDESDWDINDVAFLIYGTEIPQPVDIHEGDPIVKTRNVRYMIEDLGATDDFDFNDIVIDMNETTTTTPTITNGVITSWSDEVTTQTATIRHLGGTLPFILTIGDTTLDEMGGEATFQTNPNTEFRVSGWDADKHNISVKVQQLSNAGVYNNVKFPKEGEAPMIIAVNPTQNWMGERIMVPTDWFYLPSHR